MSLRTRTIVAAAAPTMLAVAVLGLALDVLVARHLRSELDRSLRTRTIGVAQLAASAPALVTTPGALDAATGGAPRPRRAVPRRSSGSSPGAGGSSRARSRSGAACCRARSPIRRLPARRRG